MFNTFTIQFREERFNLRSLTQHMSHLAQLQDEDGRQRSTEFGVNRQSLFMDLEYFSLCDGSLVPDVLHDVLEGVLQYETKLLLKHYT